MEALTAQMQSLQSKAQALEARNRVLQHIVTTSSTHLSELVTEQVLLHACTTHHSSLSHLYEQAPHTICSAPAADQYVCNSSWDLAAKMQFQHTLWTCWESVSKHLLRELFETFDDIQYTRS